MATTIEDATFEVAFAREADVRKYGSLSLARANGRKGKPDRTDANGNVWFTIREASPRGMLASGRINGRDDASTFIPRDAVRSIIVSYATPRDADGKPTGKPDAKVVAAGMARFPEAGEPDAPAREHVASVTALRDAILAHAASRSWTFDTRKARKASKVSAL